MSTPQLGTIGIWTRKGEVDPAFARELEQAGYGALWIGDSPSGDLAIVDPLLEATESIVVATGIVNIWSDDAKTVAASHHRLTAAHPGRFLLGIGVGHPEATSDYTRPYKALVDYLDVLDAEGVPANERVLAALGPKVLELARDRSAGAHPYLTPPEHTRRARELLGPDTLIAPEQKLVIEPDPDKARAIGRPPVADPYLGLRNYVSNLERLGWTSDDVADGGSDALIDALVGHGDPATAAGRVREHLAAGANHVPIQLLGAKGDDRIAPLRALAAELLG